MFSPKYYLQHNGQFVIENYNFAKSFSSFLPGVAGLYGKPLWSFYVNRGQGICSFGVENRDNMILEFFPADQAYQRTGQYGFRTFYKIRNDEGHFCYEPFRNHYISSVQQKMVISGYDVTFEDRNIEQGILTTINIFTLSEEQIPALMRSITIKNVMDKNINLEVADGLPRIMPYGMNEFFCKNMSRTSEAWMGVQNLDEQSVPFYKLKVIPLDAAKVLTLEKGNFYLAFDEKTILKPIVNSEVLFGPNTDFSYPLNFCCKDDFTYPEKQITDNRTPAGLIYYKLNLAPGQEKKFYQIIGQVDNLENLRNLVPKLATQNYFLEKQKQNKNIISSITRQMFTFTSSAEFDFYARQTFLDNVLRGGMPITISDQKCQTFYVYSRKHGDLERDYNKFNISPTYFSQGDGNYRDVNQNRRSDVFFNPDLQMENIYQMLNLIQLDGYNPLIIKGKKFKLEAKSYEKLKQKYDLLIKAEFIYFFAKDFAEGDLVELLKPFFSLREDYTKLMQNIIDEAKPIYQAEHGDGFWSDHWHYNLDLIENFLNIFPDKKVELFIKDNNFCFYDDVYFVLPRSKRYGKDEQGQIRQINFVKIDDNKAKVIAKRVSNKNLVHSKNNSEVYKTNLTVKILHLILIKACTIDPMGTGIEMEAGKPNWYDAINGLPALFGSSSSELFELKRWAIFLKNNLQKLSPGSINIPEEINKLFKGLLKGLNKFTQNEKQNFLYWDESNNLKEDFRTQVFKGLSGREKSLKTTEIIEFLEKLISRIDTTLIRDKKSGVYFSYFRYEAEEFSQNKNGEYKISKFKQIPLPLFLEGPMHSFRLINNVDKAFREYAGIKKSSLYDQKLKMYKVNSSLAEESLEIGRNKVFTPGWLENESIWMHMQYKYLLEILKTGLYKEFNEEFKNLLVAFQDPKIYGRSILENSSFIASSANPDENTHGQGFVARLSGSTAEFVEIWIKMFFGSELFGLDNNNNLTLTFKPRIPYWLFTESRRKICYKTTDGQMVEANLEAKSVLANFMGNIPVFFYNPSGANTWDIKISKIKVYPIDADVYEVLGDTISNAENIREKKVNRIEIYF